METGPHLSSRAQNRRVVSTLMQAAQVDTDPNPNPNPNSNRNPNPNPNCHPRV